MNDGTVMGSIVPGRDIFTAPSVPQATIHDQFMMAAITGILARGGACDYEELVKNARCIAGWAMKNRA